MAEVNELISKKMKSFRIVHLMLVMGDIIYGLLIIYIYEYSPITPILTDLDMLTTIEYSSIAVLAVLIIIVNITRNKILASNSIFKKKETTEEKTDEPAFISNYLSSLFIIWSLIEVITVGGIVLFLVSGKIMIPLVIISISVFIKLINGPRLQELNQLSLKHASTFIQG
ncbi:hypothetical protein [Sulfurimonas sp.]|uniref:hypothetical protein n=1 Tax=Sulfurimonas sp. TaxID=2022749 RepID=UPI002AB2AD0C|nr:hypothetical protein [Sulfurimonas sp.]